MYLRIKRQPIDRWADAIVAAALHTSAPRFQQTTAQHLTMVYASGPQLTELGTELLSLPKSGPSYVRTQETRHLLNELDICSGLFVVSTNLELILVSDRSPDEYAITEELYWPPLHAHDVFGDFCILSVAGLSRLPKSH